MERHLVDAPTPTHTTIPCLATLIETQARMSTQRAPRSPGVVVRLTLGTGVALLLLLALLSTWVASPRQKTVDDTTAVTSAESQTRSDSDIEELGLAPVLFDDFFARF